MLNPWQSVKVQNAQSEHAGRAGVVIRPEGAGFVVQLDDTLDGKPKVLATFTAEELAVL